MSHDQFCEMFTEIPPNVTKCCTACFNRISRRLSPNASLDTPDDPGSDTTRWTEEETEAMKKALVEVESISHTYHKSSWLSHKEIVFK